MLGRIGYEKRTGKLNHISPSLTCQEVNKKSTILGVEYVILLLEFWYYFFELT